MERIALTVSDAPDASMLVAPASAPARATLVFAPGGGCRVDRYAWLFALGAAGVNVVIVDGMLSHPPPAPPVEGPSPVILQLAGVCAFAAGLGVPVHAAGHSAGAAAFLDALDPSSNRAACLPAGFQLPVIPPSMTVLGCSLQPRTLGFVLPHRSEDTPLWRPGGTHLLFVTGEQDALAPPHLVIRTAARYTPPAAIEVMPGATHYGWAGPREPGDSLASDADPQLDTGSQRERTLAIIARVVLDDAGGT